MYIYITKRLPKYVFILKLIFLVRVFFFVLNISTSCTLVLTIIVGVSLCSSLLHSCTILSTDSFCYFRFISKLYSFWPLFIPRTSNIENSIFYVVAFQKLSNSYDIAR